MNYHYSIHTLIKKYNDIMPTGAGVLFLIQIFATLAFSVLYSTLVLYATTTLKLSDTVATGITASFIAFHYALPLFAGNIGGRLMSYRMLFSVGLIAQFIGCIALSFQTMSAFYWALAIFLAGSGFNLTCINCMLTQLFKPDDKRREAAFLWNYSGMNIGFFIGFSMSGYYQLSQGYSILFLLSSISNLIALLIVFLKWRTLCDIKTLYSALKAIEKYRVTFMSLGLVLLLCLALRWLLEHSHTSDTLIIGASLMMISAIIVLALRQSSKEKSDKMWAYLILSFASLVFWTLYQLAPMGLTLFVARNVNLHYLGMLIAPQWVQNINTIVIIVGGPVLSVVFAQLRERGLRLTIPIQFSIALVLSGLALCLIPMGIHFANAQGFTHFNWILASFLLQSTGELFIAPIGYAMIGQLAPVNLQGMMMGTWLMVMGVASMLSGYFSNLALGNTQSLDPLVTNAGYSYTFGLLGLAAIGAGMLLFICVPLVLRLTHEKKLMGNIQRISSIGL